MDSGAAIVSVERSRDIVYSKLMMKKDEAKEFTQQLLVARHGLPTDNAEEGTDSAEIGVFKGNHNHKKLFQPPMFIIPLKEARLVEDSASTDDSKSTRDSKKLSKHSFQFGLLAADGALYKFRVRDEREHRTWTNLIKFLAMFPYSVVPEIPSYNPPVPAEMSHLDPSFHNKDSLWPVFVMPEEVGLRCRLEGPKILVLENQNGMNKLEIYSEQDHAFPLFSCKHSEIRRIGKMGIFLYVEVGRRCRAGPGLLWLFFGSSNEKAVYMREVLCKFLLNKEPLPHLHSNLTPTKLTRSSTAPMLAEALPSSPPPLPPDRIGSPRHRASLTTPSSPLLQRVQSTSACVSSRSNLDMVADKPAKQKYLCNSYHTLEPLQDTKKDALEPLEGTDPVIHQGELLQDTSHQAPQYHIIEPLQLSDPAPHGSPVSPEGQASLYHVLEHPQNGGHTAPAMYHVLECQGRSPDSLQHVLESPKRSPPSPYFVTELQNMSGSEMSPQWSVGSPVHRSPSRTPEIQTDGGLERNPYHILEAPPSARKSVGYHVLESPPVGRRHFSEKPRRHKLNTSHSQDSYHQLEPPTSEDDPHNHLYHEIGHGLSKSFTHRTDRNRSINLVQMHHQQQHKYNTLEPNELKPSTRQLQHQYDAVNFRMPRRHSEESHHQHYHMLGLKEEPKPTMDSNQPPIYHTIAKN